MFRDTFAVEMLLAGVPIDQVSLLLGHASVKITEKSYAPFVKARQLQLQESVRNAWKLAQSPGSGPEGGPPAVLVTENKRAGWQLIRSRKRDRDELIAFGANAFCRLARPSEYGHRTSKSRLAFSFVCGLSESRTATARVMGKATNLPFVIRQNAAVLMQPCF